MPVISYKCPACGGEVTYNPRTRGFDCPYCNSCYPESEINNIWRTNEATDLTQNLNAAYNLDELERLEEFNQHTNLYTCSSCGAEIIADDATSATACVYCHNPVILSGRLSGNYKPDKLIPFSVDKKGAEIIFTQWTKKLWFIPKDFKNSVADINGIYVPYWLADCDTSSYMGAVGKNVRSWREGSYMITETKEYEVERRGNLHFLDIPADGANQIEDDLLGAIEPYNYNGFRPFSMSYLSGFVSNKFDADKDSVMPRIRKRVDDASEKYMRSTISGYSSVSVVSSTCSVLKTVFEYALLPVWFLNHKYKDVNYQLVINGQTGKIAGTPPLSHKKLLLVSWLLGVLVFFVGSVIFDPFLSFFAGIITTALFFILTERKYRFKKQTSALDYLRGADLSLRRDVFLKVYRSRSRIDNK
jgi:DNA-directed RNA polymerase subunit RPC12/RpoP